MRSLSGATSFWSLFLVCLAAVGLGCAGAPISMQVQAGSTILIPLPGDDFSLSPGFGSEVTQSQSDYDDQRGEFVFYLRDPGGVLPDYPLRTRYVTRVYPDSLIQGPFGSELLALADIPLPTDTPAGPSVSSAKEFKVIVKRKQRDLSQSGQPYGPESGYFDSYVNGTPDLRMTVIPGTATPNPFVGWQGSLASSPEYLKGELFTRLPLPQLVIQVGDPGAPGSGKPGAVQFDLSYPDAKALIQGVGEWQHAGRYSVVRYRAISTGVIRVWLVDPEESVSQVGIAFSLRAPTTAGRAQTSDFAVSNVKLFHKNGSSYTSSTYPTIIGIR